MFANIFKIIDFQFLQQRSWVIYLLDEVDSLRLESH